MHRAYRSGRVDLHAKREGAHRRVPTDEDGNVTRHAQLVDTTVGRALLYQIVPKQLPFDGQQGPWTKKAISNLLNACYRRSGV